MLKRSSASTFTNLARIRKHRMLYFRKRKNSNQKSRSWARSCLSRQPTLFFLGHCQCLLYQTTRIPLHLSVLSPRLSFSPHVDLNLYQATSISTPRPRLCLQRPRTAGPQSGSHRNWFLVVPCPSRSRLRTSAYQPPLNTASHP